MQTESMVGKSYQGRMSASDAHDAVVVRAQFAKCPARLDYRLTNPFNQASAQFGGAGRAQASPPQDQTHVSDIWAWLKL